jgi:signal transduction histidine kinase
MPAGAPHMPEPEAHILVVDDEPNVRLTLKAILQEDGYRVDTAVNGEQAIVELRARPYDLVLTDLKMPGIDGLGVLQEVQRSSPSTVTIMMTGYGSVTSAIEAVHLGAYEYLLKPMEVPELKQAVCRSLERKRLSEVDSLYRVAGAVAANFDRETIAKPIEGSAQQVLRLGAVELIPLHSGAADTERAELAILLGDRVLRSALEQGYSLTSQECPPALLEWAKAEHIASFAIVPGIANGRLACVMLAHNHAERFDFHASALRYLQALAGQGALALSNASLFAQLQQNNLELESANRKLRELDRLRTQFLSIATHELRTPLTIMMGYNSMLMESLDDRATAEEKELLDESVTACQRLIRMVNSMLDITQIEAGRMRIDFAAADLPGLVNNVVGLFQTEAAKKDIQLSADVPAYMPRILLDADRIEQVVINLVGNALKFTNPGGRIHVSLQHNPGAETVKIAVSDNGVGIAVPYHDLIFDEFAQIERHSAKRHREGTGLGLAIAKRIVEAHLGAISVESQPGLGSTFIVILPVRRPQANSSYAVSA